MRLSLRFAGLAAFVAGALAAADVPRFVLATRTPDGAIRFEAIDSFTIAGKAKVRLWRGNGEVVFERDYKRTRLVNLRDTTALRRDGAGRLIQLGTEDKVGPVFVLPDGFPVKNQAPLTALIAAMDMAAMKAKGAKRGAAVPYDRFFALLAGPGGVSLVIPFVLKESNFLGVDEHLAALAGAVRSFPGASEIAEIREFVVHRMRNGLTAFEEGGPYDQFLIVVKFAALAGAVFPDDPRCRSLANDVNQRRSLTERQVAVLRSRANNNAWDEFLDAYNSFEPYQDSFPDLKDARARALQESARIHAERGTEVAPKGTSIPSTQGERVAALQKLKQALAEFSVAINRDPDNQALRDSRESYAMQEASIARKMFEETWVPLPEGSSEQVFFNRHLDHATRYARNKQFDEAAKELRSAQVIKSDAPDLLYVQALLDFERGDFSQVLPRLDEFGRRPVTKEAAAKAEELRNDVLFRLKNDKPKLKEKIAALVKAGAYSEADKLAQETFQMDQDDDELSYWAGLTAAVLRRDDDARRLFRRYLDLSISLRGDLKRRSQVTRLLAILDLAAPPAANGRPYWFSGRPVKDDIFYCPQSLFFIPRIAAVTAHKAVFSYDWTKDGRLRAVHAEFADAKGQRNYEEMVSRSRRGDADAAQKDIYFTYYADAPGALKVSYDPKSAETAEAPFAVTFARTEKWGFRMVDRAGEPAVLLGNNRFVDPGIVAAIAQPATTGVSGNAVFNPFVWDGIHYFDFAYDRSGRLERARELGADNQVRFSWDGERLTALEAFSDGGTHSYYRRTLSYKGSFLVSETVSWESKSYRVNYQYSGDHLQEAEFSDSGAHDGKSWKVRFVP